MAISRLVTVFSAKIGGFVTGTRRMTTAMRTLQANVATAGKAINSSITRIGTVTGIVAGLSIKHYAEFEKRMAAVGAISRANARDFKKLSEMAKKLGRDTIFTATQAAEAEEIMAMAGLSATEIMTALGPALQLAAVGEVEISQAAEIAAKTMRGMNLQAEDLTRVNNVLAGAMTTSTTNMTQLGDALKYVAPLAAATNTSIEDTVAMIGKLSSAGFQGEMAGTGLRQAMAKLAGSTPHATKVLGEFGIVTTNAAGNMLPMLNIIQQMEDANEGLGLTAGQVFEVFGARAGPQMLTLLNIGAEGLRMYSGELRQAHNEMLAARIEQEKINTIWGDWRKMLAAVSGLILDAVEGIADEIRQVQQAFIEFFNGVENRQQLIERFQSILRKTVEVIKNLGIWIVQTTPSFLSLASAIGSVLGPIFAFLAANPKLTAALVALKVAGLLGVTAVITSLLPLLKSLAKALFLPVLTWLQNSFRLWID